MLHRRPVRHRRNPHRARQGPRPHRAAHRQRRARGHWLSGERRFPGELRLPDAASIVRVAACIRRGEKTHAETRYYISSARLTAEAAGRAVRGHWGIENRLHWVLDVTFNDDQSRLRKGFGAKNMAVVRHFALNLVRAAKDTKSVKLRRKVAGWTPDYLDQILNEKVR
ncbi:MAG TPA: ISAs1 family transposase [Acetobacteraceae bacterium]|nr:ISAs1 family transposase [Acetobacteraceae bacterium]